MRKDHFEELKTLIGKTIKEIRADTKYNIAEDYSFELVFTDNTSLAVLFVKCLAYDDCDMAGKEKELTMPYGKKIVLKYTKEQLGGWVDWVIWDDQQPEE